MSTAEAHSRWAIIVVAALQFATAVVAWRTHVATAEIKEDVKMVEVQTNSIKDQLVAATAKASRAEGVVEGRKEEKLENKEEAKQP